jgi:hypothetical protein
VGERGSLFTWREGIAPNRNQTAPLASGFGTPHGATDVPRYLSWQTISRGLRWILEIESMRKKRGVEQTGDAYDRTKITKRLRSSIKKNTVEKIL